MNPTSKKFISLFLTFSLMAISCTTMTTQRQKRFESSKERKHGAKLIITKKNGYQTEGELITVKPNSLLLLSITGRDMSVGIADIKVIRIVKKSKALLAAGLGFLTGAAVGAAVGGQLSEAWWWEHGTEICAVIGGFAFGILGGFIVSSAGKDKIIQIEGTSDLEIEEALEKLRKKARIRDYK